jgi:methionyl-tRNA synthetase
MVGRYRDGVLPDGVMDEGIQASLERTVEEAERSIDDLDFQSALGAVMAFVRTVNGYVTEQAPWKVAKDENRAADLDAILYTTADALRAAAVLLNPVMPKACATLWDQLGAPGALADARVQKVADEHLPAGSRVVKGDLLFPRLADEPAA